MAGVGKTAMASVLARQYAKPEKVFWHSFHAREGIETIIWKLAGFLAWHGQGELWRMLQITQQTGGQTQTPENLFDYVIELVKGQNYLLCFDDFQFVDDDPRLNQLVGRLREAVFAGELSIIITSRRIPEFVNVVDFDPLSGMSIDDTQLLLQKQGFDLSSRHLAALHLHTGGNAQLLRLAINAIEDVEDPSELIRTLSETEDIERYLLKEVDDALTGEERDVMGIIAIFLGYAGSYDAIASLFEAKGVRRSLRRLSDRQLLIINDGEYGKEYVQHSIVQAFYYDHFAKGRRRKMHLQAADFYDAEEPDLLKTTMHAERGGDAERAADLANAHVRTFINLGQARSLQAILDRFKENAFKRDDWVTVLITTGHIYALLGERDKAHIFFKDATEKLGTINNDKEASEFANICLRMGELLSKENPEKAISWLQKGLEYEQRLNDLHKADLYNQLGITYKDF
ncbi:MAG: hypothetical protein AAF633_28520, partial [Chloroflexota bacterium]